MNLQFADRNIFIDDNKTPRLDFSNSLKKIAFNVFANA